MRNNKNNTTLRLENIISFFRNITSYFTGKAKTITLVLTIIMLSFTNITLYSSNIFNNPYVSALSYQSSVGVGFTFDPTLSVSLSSSDLVISNLVPGSTLDSNVINVSVASNASYGYALSTIVNGNNSNLTHSNGTNIFSSIDTNADLSSLDNSEDTNIWGYSYKDNTVASPTWSNYNGLSNSNGTTLINTNSNTSSNLDFKIAAKAGSTQPSGEYTGTINFIAISKVAPMSLLDSFIASGAEQLNGYFKMQDMTHSICQNVDIEESELQLIDIRDYKIYWVAKLKDGNCWMTQNLDLDIDDTKTYTHYDTDLGWTTNDETATWKPTEGHSTINFVWTTVPGWQNSDTEPYSASPGDMYFYTSNSSGADIQYYSLQECVSANHTDCPHYSTGNYYNWPAAIASNNANNFSSSNAPDSICSTGWRLPYISNDEFGNVLVNYGIISASSPISQYVDDGFNRIRQNPLYFTRANCITNANRPSWQLKGTTGYYWAATIESTSSKTLEINSNSLRPKSNYTRRDGFSIRCLAR